LIRLINNRRWQLLRQSGIQVVEFRASIIIGSGSLFFELIRITSTALPLTEGSPGKRGRKNEPALFLPRFLPLLLNNSGHHS
jgi:hypothetical protein